MAGNMSVLIMNEDPGWIGSFGGLHLPRHPTESDVKEYLQKLPIQIRQESKMVGNNEGLNGFDAILKRIETLEKKNRGLEKKTSVLENKTKELNKKKEILQDQVSALGSDMNMIRIPELLRFLPVHKRPGTFFRNEMVHGGNVEFDLSFLKSLTRENWTFLSENNLKRSDLDMAFEHRYGWHPTVFIRNSLPKEIAQVVNMRSNLQHLDFWKNVTESTYLLRRQTLMGKCDVIIHRWLNQTEALPYSQEATLSELDDLITEYYA